MTTNFRRETPAITRVTIIGQCLERKEMVRGMYVVSEPSEF
jgi:hypothetical protein